jgi:rod shape-determining protein MreC
VVDVPRLAAIQKGDTIVTGGQSVIFPENINIGTIDKIEIDNQMKLYTITVRLFNDMTNYGAVCISSKITIEEINNLKKGVR